MISSSKTWLWAAALALPCVSASIPKPRGDTATCTKTTVAILGGGMAGVAAAKALSNNSIHDFVIVEYRDTLGGRVAHTTFGQDANGEPYTVELGANWVQGLGQPGGPQNPVWTFAQEYGLNNTYSNYSSIITYDENGANDYSALLDTFDNAYSVASENAGVILKQNLQDQTGRSGLALAGWKPKVDAMKEQAVEWWNWDWEDAFSPDESSFVFGVAGENLTFNQFSDANNYVWDQRGYNKIIKDEAATFLKKNDPRLHLNSPIAKISYSHSGVIITKEDGSCISADYAVCTFSLGVLQNDVVEFTPSLPFWKRTAIEKFTMGTYTKIFLQFNETFWPEDTQYFLYADPLERGYYPVWQSLSAPGFLEGSNIIFVTVVADQAWKAERQTDEQTKNQVMDVLRKMYPHKNIPEPTDFMYPRWTTTPWAHGSYSNWPAATTLEMHENLRANVGRLWFAGEATSAPYFGFLHGAYFEGLDAGEQIAHLLRRECSNVSSTAVDCGDRVHYQKLYGSSPLADYSVFNGWPVSSFYEG
ncbi:hypothetical protein N7474_002514 [Penicillium riverlandense]|uniref:uncharacterized protein n=1 Tax=Penicillium riverlandense TaxID=1903569 RepID=UPI002548401D|nr:uncharacterized protein N7474_002514 [Penicillium riverlandense]KAJ5825376.1 hypothetical protein N7474_002514 [Penicillium riverlandense]